MRLLTLYLMGALYRTSRKSGPRGSREDGLNIVCQRNDAVKPGERRKQKEKRRKPCCQLTEPFQRKPGR